MLFYFYILWNQFNANNIHKTTAVNVQKHLSFLYTVKIVHPGLIVNVCKIKFIEITNALNLA